MSKVAHRHGYDATMRDIAKAAHLSTATIYRYFPGKKPEVLGTLAQKIVDETLATSERLLEIEDGREIFLRWAEVGFDHRRARAWQLSRFATQSR